MSNNWIDWFEVPVTNFDRAKEFYETIFDLEIETRDFDSFKMGIFSDPERQAAGAICQGEWYVPGDQGPLVYLNANPDLDNVLEKVEDAGGEIISEKKQISEQMGYMALFYDSEGNRIALRSDK